MPYAMIVQALISMASQAKADGLSQQAIDLQKQQLARQLGVPLPDLEKIAATELPPSQVAALGIDQGLKAQQQQNLGALQDIIANGGMSLSDQVDQNAAMDKSAAAANRGQQTLAANLASRGQLNSGAAVALGQGAEQQNANNANQAGMAAAASAQQRKMDALKELSNEASAMRNQDFSEKNTAAQAADARNQWNAASQEKAGYYNAGLNQQQFQNALNQATGAGGAANNLASTYLSEANGVRQQGAGTGAAAYNGVQGATVGAPPSPQPSSNGGGSGGGATVSQPADQSTYTWSPPANSPNYGTSGYGVLLDDEGGS